MQCLPLYEAFACGAPPPQGRQYTLKWYMYLSKVDVLVSLEEDLYYLKRSAPRKERYFNVLGELRAAPECLTLGNIIRDPCEAQSAPPAWADPAHIASLPLRAEVVVHKTDQPDWYIRDAALWERLSEDRKDEVGSREAALLGVPASVVCYCLGADALMNVHKLAIVLRAFAQQRDPSPDTQHQAMRRLCRHLSLAGVESGLLASTEWLFPKDDWTDPINVLGFALGQIAHPDAPWGALRRRVAILGLEGPCKKKYYLGLTELGALSDAAVETHNQGTCASLVRLQQDALGALAPTTSLGDRWPLFAAEPEQTIVFPSQPSLRDAYLSALTGLGRQRAQDPEVTARCHRKGCVCAWLPVDKEALVCGLCDPTQHHTGTKQFCDHLNGRKHNRRCYECPAMGSLSMSACVHW